MRHTAIRWLFALGVLATAGALLVGQGTAAVASPPRAAARGRASAPARGRASAPARGRASASAYVPPSGILSFGMDGPAVRSLQRRLAALKYYPGPIDGHFGEDTLEAVWAFKETQGLVINNANQDRVSRATEQALLHPRAPRVLVPDGGGTRIEVNMADQVLVLYKNNQVDLISHVSTGAGCLPGHGCGWDTPTGNYHALSFAPGWVTVTLGEMYNPVFFIGTMFAIHGEWDANVPWYPDSHGCVRIPYDTATFFYELIKIPGTPIYIRG